MYRTLCFAPTFLQWLSACGTRSLPVIHQGSRFLFFSSQVWTHLLKKTLEFKIHLSPDIVKLNFLPKQIILSSSRILLVTTLQLKTFNSSSLFYITLSVLVIKKSCETQFLQTISVTPVALTKFVISYLNSLIYIFFYLRA